jgi:hypothetical protein
MVGIGLDLSSGVTDAKSVVQVVAYLRYKCVARMSHGHYEMCGEGRLGRADRPDMQIVDFINTCQCGKVTPTSAISMPSGDSSSDISSESRQSPTCLNR